MNSSIPLYTVNSEIFANTFKRHICDVKNSQLWHDIPQLEDDIFRKGFIFTKSHPGSYAKKKLSKNSDRDL